MNEAAKLIDNPSSLCYLTHSAGFILVEAHLAALRTLPGGREQKIIPDISMQLAQRLVTKGIIPQAELPRIAEAQAAAPSRPLHELLVEQGFAKEEQVLAALAEEFGMDLVDLTTITVEQ